MNTAKLIQALNQIQALVADCLKEFTPQQPRGKHIKAHVDDRVSPANSLPAVMLRQRDRGFFKQAKTSAEVHADLKPIYDCDPNRVAVALVRLTKRKQLRKTSKQVGETKQVAYVW